MVEQEKGQYDVSQKMAELFIAANKDNPLVISIEPYEIDGITCFYIFNFEHGYKIVSADMRVQPILAESTEENLYPQELNNNGIRIWLEDTADRIRVLKKNNLETHEDHSEIWSQFVDNSTAIQTRSLDPNQDSIWIKVIDLNSSVYSVATDVDHLLSTKWGGDLPWNWCMPEDTIHHQCDAGSEAVAAAQILYYYHNLTGVPSDMWHGLSISSYSYYPGNPYSYKSISLSRSDYHSISTKWEQLSLTDSGTNTYDVSKLILDLGERMGMFYNYHAPISYALTNQYSLCSITSTSGNFDFLTVEGNLTNDNPVLVSATHNSNSQISIHNWVIDGCQEYTLKNTVTSTYYYVAVEDAINYLFVAAYSNDDMLYLFPNAYNGMQTFDISYEYRKYLRMNWGCSGNGDSGVYGILNSSDWEDGDGHNYLYHRAIYYNISTSQLN